MGFVVVVNSSVIPSQTIFPSWRNSNLEKKNKRHQLNNQRTESSETIPAITYQQLFLLCYADG
jgi:hypothetical protein